MTTAIGRRIVLAARPQGQVTSDDFHMEESTPPALEPGASESIG